MDDMALLRSDGSPTYMLACVVDDYDMVTHVIRGDDHLNNAFRQMQLYNALGWNPPEFAHIPLIHDSKGKKMSKRTGITSLDEYRDMGIPSSAMLNYLLRLGWSYGDKEIFTKFEAVQLFDLKNIGKSPAKFDIERLKGLAAYHINKKMGLHELMDAMSPYMPEYTKCQKIGY